MNPYSELPEKSFWKPSVASKHFFDIAQLWNPKFQIEPHHKVATYGSCFAQHIGRALDSRGFNWNIVETAPFLLSTEKAKEYNYGIFSSRTGNIYTASLLLQWVRWALDLAREPEEVWKKGERFFDPFRPNIEPNGFETEEELLISRSECIRCFKESIANSNFFVFTLGLTESWINEEKGYEYPMCPGTVAGDYDSDSHTFVNQNFLKIYKDLTSSIKLMRKYNPKLKFILTVSPVPLTATNSDDHVLVATMNSKSILRAVAGQIAEERANVDYFPSYEIINSPAFKGTFFEPNQRSVNPKGVETVMNHFFSCQVDKFGSLKTYDSQKEHAQTISYDEVCEEELLEAFDSPTNS